MHGPKNIKLKCKNEVRFFDPLLYFDLKPLFDNVSVTDITNVYYQGSLGYAGVLVQKKIL
jgi:hypothetical protein